MLENQDNTNRLCLREIRFRRGESQYTIQKNAGVHQIGTVDLSNGITIEVMSCSFRSPPFNPEVVVYEISELLKRYRIRTVTGDRYAGSWVTSSFEKFGIEYQTCEKPKSDLYLMLEGLINTGRVEFAKDERLIRELVNLERRRGRSGRDIADHPPRGNDDLANALAGLAHLLVKNEHSFFAEVL